MSVESRINLYLDELAAALHLLAPAEKENILREIRSHLEEEGARDMVSLEAAISDLGNPRELADCYAREQRLSAARVRRWFPLLLLVMLAHSVRSVKAAPALAVGASLYFFAAAFTIIALIRPLAPDGLAGFVGKFGLGPYARTPEQMNTLGWALLPVGLTLAVAAALAGTAILRRGARNLLRRQR